MTADHCAHHCDQQGSKKCRPLLSNSAGPLLYLAVTDYIAFLTCTINKYIYIYIDIYIDNT